MPSRCSKGSISIHACESVGLILPYECAIKQVTKHLQRRLNSGSCPGFSQHPPEHQHILMHLKLIHLVQCQVNLVFVSHQLFADASAHDLARDASFSMENESSMELIIADLSHENKINFQSQRSEESAV